MIKKLILSILIIFLFTFNAFADEAIEEKNIISINPIGLLINSYNGHYSRLLNDGKNELYIPFHLGVTTFLPEDEFSIGAKYRYYLDENTQGVFYGVGFRTGWRMMPYYGGDLAFFITPTVQIGHRWIFDSQFTIAPTISGGIPLSKGDIYPDKPGIILWRLGIGLGYMF
ncbi:hypothetical protein [Natronospora cellulosivora (SeqCode)]